MKVHEKLCFSKFCIILLKVSVPARHFIFFSNYGEYKKKIAHLIGAHIIKQLKVGCPGCEIQGKDFFL